VGAGELNNGFTLTRKFTEKNPKGYLTIEGPGLMEGTRTKYKQSDVSGWLGDISFDLLALFRLKPRDLRDTLLSLAKDPELRSKLDGIAADRERIREERTPFLSVKQRAERTPKPTGERPEPVDVSGEMAKLAELEAEAERYREARDSGDAAMDAANDATEDLKETEEEIRRLEEQLKDAKDRRMLEVDRMKLLGLAAAKAKDDADKLTDPRDQIATVRARISEADQIRRALAPWDAWERIQTEAKEATARPRSSRTRWPVWTRRRRNCLPSPASPWTGSASHRTGRSC
jgi:hypothetical protein